MKHYLVLMVVVMSSVLIGSAGASASIDAASSASAAEGALRPDKVHVADGRKSQAFIKDGLIVGGDKTINEVVVKDIRRALNQGFERIVIDLEANRNGESVAIQRPPFYQLSVTPDERRLVFTIWGKPKLAFDAAKVVTAFRKSPVVSQLSLYPILENDSWTFAFELKADQPVEVFELSNPVRIIVDIRTKAHP